MEKRHLGQTDMEVSVLGFGGAEVGYENVAIKTVETLLAGALDAGLNVIDTAECYDSSEELIGQAVGHRRKDFYLFTKCGHPNGVENAANWSPKSILESIGRSLQRLRTDHLDIVQLHSCSESVLRNGDAIAALQTARDRGYTRYIGYSGDSAAARYAIECGAFDTLQTSVNIADQEAIELTLPLARERKLGVIAKRPIANAAWKTGHKPIPSYQHEYWQRLATLKYDFIENIHGPANLPASISIALRFTLSVPGLHTAIIGTTKPKRWEENARLLKEGPLSKSQFQAIRDRWEEVAAPVWVGQT